MNLNREITILQAMSVGELRERYAELHGENCRSRHRTYLIRRIVWKLQARAEGGLSERARQRAAELTDVAEARVTPPNGNGIPAKPRTRPNDPRIPAPGNMIVRDYKGRTVQVLVTEDGFEYEGEPYGSLSAVAKAVTDSHMNGFRFFKLEDRK
ncbi:hypothetical protein CA54_21850 [Symmachiella macrocystis]|uniref:DUF2924 domain-containing protein n=1 Tax=Symmachiella macrocystis TaxID=2527985 RepID=A0A5C6BMH4_9PLAN|nr:DUF2924 domain-containing protein [Symmachiella macrocystis]TWU13350.1 hypothetical protein CA54_21850 [Symmachiella macrocystis]